MCIRDRCYLRSTGLSPECALWMVVDGGTVAAELRRRRLGRRGLAQRCADSLSTTWLPAASDDLRSVNSELLLLAALALAGPGFPPAGAGEHEGGEAQQLGAHRAQVVGDR